MPERGKWGKGKGRKRTKLEGRSSRAHEAGNDGKRRIAEDIPL
jgi:hypothetical protein